MCTIYNDPDGIYDVKNCITLCANHHHLYDNRGFALKSDNEGNMAKVVPSEGKTFKSLNITKKVISIDYLDKKYFDFNRTHEQFK